MCVCVCAYVCVCVCVCVGEIFSKQSLGINYPDDCSFVVLSGSIFSRSVVVISHVNVLLHVIKFIILNYENYKEISIAKRKQRI